jgi:hypothetical protein
MKPGTAAFLFQHAADAANEPPAGSQTGASADSNNTSPGSITIVQCSCAMPDNN